MKIYDPNIEPCVIGALCIAPEKMKEVARFLRSEDFTILACEKIYGVMFTWYINNQAIDINLLPQELKDSIGDPFNYIRECMMLAPTTNNVVLHAHVIHDAAKERRFQSEVMECFNKYSGDDLATEILKTSQDYLREGIGGAKTLFDLVNQALDNLSKPLGLRINTGFPRLDGILKGMRGGNLIIIGARPSVGKTAFALDLAVSAAKQGHKTLFYSMEMTSEELVQRLLSTYSGVQLSQIIDGQMDDNELLEYVQAGARISGLPVLIEDASNVTVETIRTKAIEEQDVKIIFVDYIGLLQSTKNYQNRNYELGAMSRDLKNLAMELKIPIVVLAQLNRNVNSDQEPNLSDLRDSGELEQNANKVIFLWNIDEEEGIRGVKVAKNRNGRIGTVQMNFDGEHQKFIERSEDIEYRKAKSTGRFSDDDEY
ncbi:MAG: AAA family ATPase [Oscillospiraceae bacterium]|nr:AAA family ATPase [Clostridiales bacterium]MBR3353884.1 AAA family ATPase [Oscillospiraceae bacterium]